MSPDKRVRRRRKRTRTASRLTADRSGTMEPERSRYHVESLARGLAVLTQLSLSPLPMSIADITAATGMNISNVFRVLQTLSALGIVERIEATKTFRLTYRSIKLGYNAFAHLDIADLARPALQRLYRAVNESVFLSVLAVPNIISIVRILQPQRLHMVGHTLPAYATPDGKVLLAHLDQHTQRLHFNLLPQTLVCARHTLSRSSFISQLEEVRAQGWAATDEELALNTRGVAAPVFDRDHRCVAAVAVAAAHDRKSYDFMIEAIRPKVLETAAEISALLKIRYETK